MLYVPISITLTDIWISDVTTRILIKEWFTLLTVPSHCIMFTIITNTTTDSARSFKDSTIKVTSSCMAITVTSYITKLISNKFAKIQ